MSAFPSLRSRSRALACAGHAIAATGCRRSIQGAAAHAVEIPPGGRVLVCADCFRWWQDRTGAAPSLRNRYRWRVMGFVERAKLPASDAAWLGKDEMGEWRPVAVVWAPSKEVAIAYVRDTRAKFGPSLGLYARLEARKLAEGDAMAEEPKTRKYRIG